MIKFANLQFIWFFAIVVLIIFLTYYSRWRRNRDLRVFGGSYLSERLLDGYRPVLRHLKENIFIVSIIFFTVALIGPQVGKKLVEVKREGIDIIISLDTSVSMNAEDIRPNRLMRAKYEIGKFIDRLRGDRVGLVAFAGTSYLHCPLTLDYSAAKLFLDVVDTDIIGTQGTAIADAISTALDAFKGEEKRHKVVIVVSDGEDHEGKIDLVLERANQEGVVIYSVGAGTLSGAPIPIYDKDAGTVEFKKDRTGRVVTTALKQSTLQQIASSTGGKYYNLSSEPDAFEKIYEEIFKMEKKELRSHEYSDYEERYQIFLLIGLMLFITEMCLPERAYKREKFEK